MKILMINGSPHPRGCTYTALHEMEQVLQAAEVETQILTVGAEQIGGCTACGATQSGAGSCTSCRSSGGASTCSNCGTTCLSGTGSLCPRCGCAMTSLS